MTHVLVLGGTTEAGALARLLAAAGIRAVYSYAGRTGAPAAQPLPVRTGGFGGVAGLVGYLRAERISHVVDATHPFAAQMHAHALAACAEAGVPLVALERPAWRPGPGDDWRPAPDIAAAVAALPEAPARVFLAIGRQNLAPFADRPQHRYLLRFVDPPEAPPPLPDCVVVVDRGPFDANSDAVLMRAQGIEMVVAKNAGGVGARAKLEAARALALPVIMIDRPPPPPGRAVLAHPEAVMGWIGGDADHAAPPGPRSAP
jgi:precorrin-6A/cobalt-precorrin-6A reductase